MTDQPAGRNPIEASKELDTLLATTLREIRERNGGKAGHFDDIKVLSATVAKIKADSAGLAQTTSRRLLSAFMGLKTATERAIEVAASLENHTMDLHAVTAELSNAMGESQGDGGASAPRSNAGAATGLDVA